jgi:uracil-DNA glycosylase
MNYPSDIQLNNLLPPSWIKYIDQDKLNSINTNLQLEIKNNNDSEFYPYNINDIFRLFHLCDLKNIKVVILGQDPYFSNKFQANGIAFSVNENIKIPPSLRNIYKEANKNTNNGDLSEWVSQGVFLLNATLTVKQKNPNSHEKIWKNFITHIIEIINKECNDIIFVAWGLSAINRYKYIDLSKHHILSCSHPSPLSCYKTNAPFIGSNIFYKINEILKIQNKDPIIW